MIDPCEVAVGDELPRMRVDRVREEDIRMMALILRDPNPIHYDLDAVARAGLGDRAVNQGGSTMAYIINLLTSWAGSRAAIARISCQFRGNVLAGDDVEVGGQVVTVDREEDRTEVEVNVWAEVVGGKRAILGSATVRLKGAAA